MKNYIGVKLISAKRMTLGDYNQLRGWDMPANENPDRDGFLVEYLDGGEPNHPGFKGYISWSPAEVFENAYRTTDGLNFGLALEAMKLGKCIARKDWLDGDDKQCLFLNRESHVTVSEGRPLAGPLAVGTAVHMLPYIMKAKVPRDRETACAPWRGSPIDILADDWQIVD